MSAAEFRIRLLSSRKHDMRRVLRPLVLRHRESQRGQVNTGKECLTLAEDNWCKCKVEGIDQPSLQILPHGGDTASDFDVLVTRCLLREPQRIFDSAADKLEGRPAFHHERLMLVVCQNEGWRMVWRIDTHHPFHELSCRGPRTGPNMLRPRMNAPKFLH